MRWTQDKINYLIENYSNYSAIELGEYLGCSAGGIHHKASRLSKQNLLDRKLTIPAIHDETCFDDINEVSAYWAGFIAADGCIKFPSGKPQLDVRLQIYDECYLDLLKDFLKTNKTTEYYTNPKTNRTYCYFRLSSIDNIYRKLNAFYNITPRKTLVLQPPTNLKDLYALCYIKGYIDGNGSVFIEKTPGTENCYRLIFNIVSYLQILEWTQTIFARNIDGYTQVKLGQNEKVYMLQKSFNQAINILNILRNLPTPELSRKWSKIDLWKQMKSN